MKEPNTNPFSGHRADEQPLDQQHPLYCTYAEYTAILEEVHNLGDDIPEYAKVLIRYNNLIFRHLTEEIRDEVAIAIGWLPGRVDSGASTRRHVPSPLIASMAKVLARPWLDCWLSARTSGGG